MDRITSLVFWFFEQRMARLACITLVDARALRRSRKCREFFINHVMAKMLDLVQYCGDSVICDLRRLKAIFVHFISMQSNRLHKWNVVFPEMEVVRIFILETLLTCYDTADNFWSTIEENEWKRKKNRCIHIVYNSELYRARASCETFDLQTTCYDANSIDMDTLSLHLSMNLVTCIYIVFHIICCLWDNWNSFLRASAFD